MMKMTALNGNKMSSTADAIFVFQILSICNSRSVLKSMSFCLATCMAFYEVPLFLLFMSCHSKFHNFCLIFAAGNVFMSVHTRRYIAE